jgi:hypothetical protein
MKNRRTHKWLSLFLIVMLVVLAGCQSVSGLDLNKVIQNGASIKSSQGTQTLTLELIPNTNVKPSTEEQQILDLFSNVKLKVTDMKQQDITHVSIKGAFEYSKGQIPYQLTVSEQDYTFFIEGAKKPIVIHNSPANMMEIKETLSKEMQEQLKQLYTKSAEFTPSFISYLGGNLPNPKNISISDAKVSIHNEGLNLKKIHAEINGTELMDLFKGFATNLLADEKGMKDMLGQIYDLFAPFLQQMLKERKDQGNPMDDMIAPYLNNKTLAVEFVFTTIQTQLKKVLKDYDTYVQSIKNNERADVIFSEKHYVKADIYVDSNLLPRKSAFEWMISAPDNNTDAIQAVKVTSTSENWDLNKPVTADVIDISKGIFELESLNKPAKVLAGLDDKSQIYQLLKNDLHLTKKEITMIMDENDSYDTSSKPYNRQGTVMVPVRFVVEQLDADVAWDQATQQVTITDPISGAVIKLNIGSKQASVNGAIKPLETEAELTNGSTFVPVRFISESMGAKVNWDQELQMVTITRD